MDGSFPLSLAALRINLGLLNPNTEQTAYLNGLLDAAATELQAAGITVDELQAADKNLLVMYAAWLYRSRVTGDGKPAMLARMINNRLLREAHDDL